MKYLRIYNSEFSWIIWIFCGTLLCLNNPVSSQDQDQDVREGSIDKSFMTYNKELEQRYKYKDYLGAIFENKTSRDGFTKFVNEQLTEEVKEDLKAVRLYKKVNGEEMPLVAFNAHMDNWLGVLPQWKRIKKFLFVKMQAYVDSHPELLEAPYIRVIKKSNSNRFT